MPTNRCLFRLPRIVWGDVLAEIKGFTRYWLRFKPGLPGKSGRGCWYYFAPPDRPGLQWKWCQRNEIWWKKSGAGTVTRGVKYEEKCHMMERDEASFLFEQLTRIGSSDSDEYKLIIMLLSNTSNISKWKPDIYDRHYQIEKIGPCFKLLDKV